MGFTHSSFLSDKDCPIHCDYWIFVYISFSYISVSSQVLTSFGKFRPALARPKNVSRILKRFYFCSTIHRHCTNLAATRCISSFPLRIIWHETVLMISSAATLHTVRRRFAWMASRTLSTSYMSLDIDGCQDFASSLVEVWPNWKHRGYVQLIIIGSMQHVEVLCERCVPFDTEYHTYSLVYQFLNGRATDNSHGH